MQLYYTLMVKLYNLKYSYFIKIDTLGSQKWFVSLNVQTMPEKLHNNPIVKKWRIVNA